MAVFPPPTFSTPSARQAKLECEHGPLARRLLKPLSLRRYVQTHTLDTDLNDERARSMNLAWSSASSALARCPSSLAEGSEQIVERIPPQLGDAVERINRPARGGELRVIFDSSD